METVVQIAAVCLAAAILGAVLRQHSPETAAVLGLAVCAVVGVLLLRGLAEVLDMLEELADRRRRDSRQRERLLWAAALSGAGLFIILLI